MNGIVSGSSVTQVDDDIYLINVVGRAVDAERGSSDTLQNLQILTPGGTSIPLLAFATVRYELEQPLVWRRDRMPTITIKAAVMRRHPAHRRGDPAAAGSIEEFAAKLPAGYKVATGGTVEESAKAQGPIAKVVPLMVFLMATFLMIQLHSVQKMFLVASVAPLGLIGVVLALVPTGTPMGFVAILGILALIGIIIRNSVILVTQIEEFVARRFVTLGCGGGSYRASSSTDPADRGGGEPGHDPDCPGSVLGADGLRDDRRDHRRHLADAAVFAGACMWPGTRFASRRKKCAKTSVARSSRASPLPQLIA